MTAMTMTPKRPYLLRAFNDWIVDNNMTPYILVNALAKDVNVPRQHIKDGKIVLNISPMAVHDFILDNEAISFSARFSGVSFYIYCPIYAIEMIYAREAPDQGVGFPPDEYPDVPAADEGEAPGTPVKPVLSAVDTGGTTEAAEDDVSAAETTNITAGTEDAETSADADDPDTDGDDPKPKKRPSLRVVK